MYVIFLKYISVVTKNITSLTRNMLDKVLTKKWKNINVFDQCIEKAIEITVTSNVINKNLR